MYQALLRTHVLRTLDSLFTILLPHPEELTIKSLHEECGPIVRINPIHIPINDPTYMDDIYASGNKHKRERDPWFPHASENGFLNGSLLQTMDHDTHRMRRGALNPFFSKRAIQDLESVLVDKTNMLVRRLSQARRAGRVVNFT
ncbi:Trichodiene oxygenase [Diaporthe amygdali]|uniref:Trichodiene oxygenase n=1 Tax=Phomopsis amygdali TaxID=1214568 RepID=UPI0022FE3CFF|nr:Trichodiene oxygenase [Diaporthe amygdali]KAJ0124041.1 Trichodiene oxygenase [Diaporthe amygdali]